MVIHLMLFSRMRLSQDEEDFRKGECSWHSFNHACLFLVYIVFPLETCNWLIFHFRTPEKVSPWLRGQCSWWKRERGTDYRKKPYPLYLVLGKEAKPLTLSADICMQWFRYYDQRTQSNWLGSPKPHLFYYIAFLCSGSPWTWNTLKYQKFSKL